MTPLDNRLLVRKKKTAEKTKGGIILPNKARNSQDMIEKEVEVVSIGEAAFLGLVIKPIIGDIVYISKYAGSDQREDHDDYEYRLINDSDVSAIKRDIDIEKVIEEYRKENEDE